MGAPGSSREVQRRFWRLIRSGSLTCDAALSVGVSATAGERWFREAGGVPSLSLAEPSGRYLSEAERDDMAIGLSSGLTQAEIARLLGRAPSTVSRELRRGRAMHVPFGYRAPLAQHKADQRARRPKASKLARHEPLRDYVQDKLSGEQHFSPQQISRRLVVDFPDDEQMRISHEPIYQALYVQGRGALRAELHTSLRSGRAQRLPRARVGTRRVRIKDMVNISERPAEVEDRAVPGHWEGDLIIGKDGMSAVGTLVERTTRFVMLLHLRGDRTAPTVRNAIATAIITLPEQLRRSLTWDQGIELAQHAQLAIDADIDVYFCDPHSPWQRGTNENTNGLLRQYMPKGTNLAVHSPQRLAEIAGGLNGRPRKTLDWRTPAEALAALLSEPQQKTGVATTP